MHGIVKVRKWGGSIGIVIPEHVAKHAKIIAGTELQMTYKENTIELSIGPTDKERLDTYLTKMLLENQRMIEAQEQANAIINQ